MDTCHTGLLNRWFLQQTMLMCCITAVCAGSRACFQVANEYLSAFQVPVRLITGNHDLEGDEFEEDSDNLTAWHEEFNQHHYWAEQLGPVLCVGLSTVRFRSNKYRCEMLAWAGQGMLESCGTL